MYTGLLQSLVRARTQISQADFQRGLMRIDAMPVVFRCDQGLDLDIDIASTRGFDQVKTCVTVLLRCLSFNIDAVADSAQPVVELELTWTV